MFQKIILCLIFIFYIFSPANANPIPVFCMAGWLDKYPNWKNACNSISYMTELDYSSERGEKIYKLYPSMITELDYSTERGEKIYKLYPSMITELDYSSERGEKIYKLYPSMITELDYSTERGEKIYKLHQVIIPK